MPSLFNISIHLFLFINTPCCFFPLQAYNIFPKIVGCFPGQLHDMFSKVEKVKALFKLEAEARIKTLDPSSPPKDFIEAFVLQMEEVKSLSIYVVVVYVVKQQYNFVLVV